ncbi:MAG: ABC transporter permease [Candidatus Binatia bacterium]
MIRSLFLAVDIAYTHLRRRKRQTFVSILGVATGVGFFIAMAAMMQGMQRYFIAKIIDVSPHIIVKDEYRIPPQQPIRLLYPQGAIALRGVKPKEELRGIRDGQATVDALSRQFDLALAPILRGQIFLRYGGTDVSATLVGVEPERERQVTRLEHDLISGSLAGLRTTANGLILGEGVAQKLGAMMNDTLSATSPAGVVMRMKVVGILRTGITAIDNFECYSLLKKAQILQNRLNVINQIRIRLPDINTASVIAAAIEQRYGYRTESWEETNKNVLGVFIIQNMVMYSTVGAILIVASFGIFNVISTIIHEKTRDIAILKSMGFYERDIRLIFLTEGLVLGLVGALCGSLLGYGLTRFLATIQFKIEGFLKTEGFILYYTPTHYFLAGIFAVTTAMIAAYLPTRKAARVQPVDIIRGAA